MVIFNYSKTMLKVRRYNVSERRYLYVTPEDFETAKRNGIPEKLVKTRVYRDGWEINRAITKKVTSKVYEPWERWKDRAVVTKYTFYQRMRTKSDKVVWTEEEAALTPKGSYPGGHRNAIKLTQEQLKIAASNGVTRRMIRHRVVKSGMTLEKAITTPKMSKKEAGKIRAQQRWGK